MSSRSGLCNLTASAHRLRLGERAGAPRALVHEDMSAEIVAPIGDVPFESGPAERDTLYIVMAGFGIVESGDEEIDFTTGDVLFVAAGVDRRFAHLSRKFRTWKILLRPK